MNRNEPSTRTVPVNGILPWTKSCFVCGEANPHGLHLRSRIADGRVVLDYTTRDADLGYRQIVHGGITMTLLDEVMTWAAIVAARRMCVAAEVTVRLQRAITVGMRMRVEGEVTRFSPRLILTTGVVRTPDGEVLASATGKYTAMPADHVALCEKDFVPSPEALRIADLLGTDAERDGR